MLKIADNIFTYVCALILLGAVGGAVGAIDAGGGRNWVLLIVLAGIAYALSVLKQDFSGDRRLFRALVVAVSCLTAYVFGNHGSGWVRFLVDATSGQGDLVKIVGEGWWTAYFIFTVAAFTNFAFSYGLHSSHQSGAGSPSEQ